MTRARALAAGLLALFAASLAGSDESVEAPTLDIAVASAAGPASGAIAGFEADLADALCARIGVDCAFVPATGDPVAALLDRKVDAVIASLPVRPKDRSIINFTRAYAEPSHGFAVLSSGPLSDLPGAGKTLSLATTPADATAMIAALRSAFAGKVLGAAPSSSDFVFLERYFRDVATIVPSTRLADDLAAGRLDAIMDTLPALDALAAQPAYRELGISGARFRDDDIFGFGIAVGVRRSDRALHDRLDRAIAAMIADGSLRQLSLTRIGHDITPHHCACKPF